MRATISALRLPDAIVLATARILDGELLTYDHKLDRLRSHPTITLRRHVPSGALLSTVTNAGLQRS